MRLIFDDLKKYGVEIKTRSNSIAFESNVAGGRIGNAIHLPEEFSISALRHEYGHFLDHKALDYPRRIKYFEQPELIVKTERRQYLHELRFAKECNDLNARKALTKHYLDERNKIVERYYQRNYGNIENNISVNLTKEYK
jgi:hypothetical protein